MRAQAGYIYIIRSYLNPDEFIRTVVDIKEGRWCTIFLFLRQLRLRHYFLYRTSMNDFYACLRWCTCAGCLARPFTTWSAAMRFRSRSRLAVKMSPGTVWGQRMDGGPYQRPWAGMWCMMIPEYIKSLFSGLLTAVISSIVFLLSQNRQPELAFRVTYWRQLTRLASFFTS